MSTYSYHFTYQGRSNDDFDSITAISFDGSFDQVSSFVETEPVYSDKFDGQRIDYGFHWQNVAEPQIHIVKKNYEPYSQSEVREILKWLTGHKQASWLTMYDEDYDETTEFFGRFTVVDEKIADSRVFGFICTFTANSPFGYSPIREIRGTFTNQETLLLENSTDDLDSLVRPYFTIQPTSAITQLTIINETTNRQTILKNIKAEEKITIDSENMLVFSDNSLRIIGEDMYGIVDGDDITNYPIWIEFVPGDNKLIIDTNGEGGKIFYSLSYRFPIKVGSTF